MDREMQDIIAGERRKRRENIKTRQGLLDNTDNEGGLAGAVAQADSAAAERDERDMLLFVKHNPSITREKNPVQQIANRFPRCPIGAIHDALRDVNAGARQPHGNQGLHY